MVADFMRYNTWIKKSHGCRFHEILRQNQNISWLQISWYIIPESKYLIVAYFTRSFTRIKISYDELREDVMIWVLETRIFESDQNECQSVVPTLYVVKICGNCILNAKNSKKQFKRSISLFSLCAEESSLLKWPIFDGNSRNENAFFSMISNSMT